MKFQLSVFRRRYKWVTGLARKLPETIYLMGNLMQQLMQPLDLFELFEGYISQEETTHSSANSLRCCRIYIYSGMISQETISLHHIYIRLQYNWVMRYRDEDEFEIHVSRWSSREFEHANALWRIIRNHSKDFATLIDLEITRDPVPNAFTF